jgi:hypothetical protein
MALLQPIFPFDSRPPEVSFLASPSPLLLETSLSPMEEYNL